MLDLDMVKCDVVSALDHVTTRWNVSPCIGLVFRQDDRCGQHLKTAVQLVLAVRRPCHFEASARSVCVMLVFTLTLTLAEMVVLACGWHLYVTVA